MAIDNLVIFIRTLNIVTGAGLIVLSIFSILDIKEWFSFKIFLLPCPFFVGFFGIALLAAELKVKFILNKLGFLKTLIGRGLFNVFLSSLVFWFLQDSEVLAWVGALVLFLSGIFYMALHFGWGKELRAKMEEKDTKEEKETEKRPNMRENLI